MKGVGAGRSGSGPRDACHAGRPLLATRASRPSCHPSEAEEGERDIAGRWFLEQRKDSGRASRVRRRQERDEEGAEGLLPHCPAMSFRTTRVSVGEFTVREEKGRTPKRRAMVFSKEIASGA